jgi:hypothetical protein
VERGDFAVVGAREERLREQKEEFINALVNFEDGCGCFYNIVLANIGKDHQETITHLVELIHNSPDDPLVRSIAAQCVGKIDPNHPDAILLTVTIVPNSFEESSELKKMETNYEDKIKSLISQICTTSDEPINFEVIQDLRHIIKLHLKSAVSALKEALPVQLNDEKDFKLHQICWEFLWQCSENLSYPDFYQAWHPDTLTNSATTSLNLANLPQDIADTINN